MALGPVALVVHGAELGGSFQLDILVGKNFVDASNTVPVMVNHPLESILDDYKICITGNSGAPGRKKGGSRYRYNPGISGLRCGSDLLRSPIPGPGESVLNQPGICM